MGQFDAFEETYDFEWDIDWHVPFYLGLARRSGGPVAEFASGTGRLLFPIAREGIEAWGVEAPGPTSARFGRRLMDQPAEVAGLVHLVEGDPAAVDFGRTFPLAFLAFGGLQLYLDDSAVDGLLGAIARHTQPGGLFALDLVRLSEGALGNPGMLRHAWSMDRPRSRETISRIEALRLAPTGLMDMTVFLDTVSETGSISRRVVRQQMRRLEPDDVEKLLGAHGFDIESISGSADGGPAEPAGDRLFVIARRREGD
jgi:SAM-dependent methyltransferase